MRERSCFVVVGWTDHLDNLFYNLLANQVYVEAAEAMLVDDVADNQAIGSHGAGFLQRQLGNSKNISVLTHCNTGR
jgi:methylthioribose-1-phosphate isomerase